MSDYPHRIVPLDHVEPVPRRLRAMLAGIVVVDTTKALYVWETTKYPQYYLPVADFDPAVVFDEDHTQILRRGTVRRHGLRVGDTTRPASVHVYTQDTPAGLAGTARIDWDAVDAWYEEDEQVFVHPRDPYVRVDALRSTRQVRVELAGTVLAESSSPVLVFETGLPTRYYLNPAEVHFEHLVPSQTITACPYKGTAGYWSARLGKDSFPDIGWTYQFPTRQLSPIAGLIAFHHERVELFIDGTPVAAAQG